MRKYGLVIVIAATAAMVAATPIIKMTYFRANIVPAAQSIGVGDPGFSVLSGDVQTALYLGHKVGLAFPAPSGSELPTVRWLFTVTPGTYEILMDWPSMSPLTQRAAVAVFDGMLVRMVTTIDLTKRRTDFLMENRPWQSIGTVTISGNALGVTMRNEDPNTFFLADAVLIIRQDNTPLLSPPPPPPPTPLSLTVDDVASESSSTDTQQVCTYRGVADQSPSADGRYIAFTGNGANGAAQILIKDRQLDRTTIITDPTANTTFNPGVAVSGLRPVISPDGRYVAFHADWYQGNAHWGYTAGGRNLAVLALHKSSDGKTVLVNREGHNPFFRGDNLFYFYSPSSCLYHYNIQTGRQRVVMGYMCPDVPNLDGERTAVFDTVTAEKFEVQDSGRIAFPGMSNKTRSEHYIVLYDPLTNTAKKVLTPQMMAPFFRSDDGSRIASINMDSGSPQLSILHLLSGQSNLVKVPGRVPDNFMVLAASSNLDRFIIAMNTSANVISTIAFNPLTNTVTTLHVTNGNNGSSDYRMSADGRVITYSAWDGRGLHVINEYGEDEVVSGKVPFIREIGKLPTAHMMGKYRCPLGPGHPLRTWTWNPDGCFPKELPRPLPTCVAEDSTLIRQPRCGEYQGQQITRDELCSKGTTCWVDPVTNGAICL